MDFIYRDDLATTGCIAVSYSTCLTLMFDDSWMLQKFSERVNVSMNDIVVTTDESCNGLLW